MRSDAVIYASLSSLQTAGVYRCWPVRAGAGRCWQVLAGAGKFWQANLENMNNRNEVEVKQEAGPLCQVLAGAGRC